MYSALLVSSHLHFPQRPFRDAFSIEIMKLRKLEWKMNDEFVRIIKTVERDQIEILNYHILGGAELNHKNPHGNRYHSLYHVAFIVSKNYKCPYLGAVWMWVHPLLPSQRRSYFETHEGPWNVQKFTNFSRWNPKPWMNKLTRINNNLLWCTVL
jgi:hypothetical protein